MKKFYFSRKKSAFLVLNRSFSNIFITLLDLKKKVVICKTSGSCNVGNSKKQKKSSQAIESIVKELSVFFELYQIKNFFIILKVKTSSHLVFLIKELINRGYVINSFVNRKKVPHNGMRGRKQRRI